MLGPVTKKDMQTPVPLLLRSGHLYVKDAQCAETNEKSFFRFSVFELLFAREITIRLQRKNCSKVAKFTENIGIDLTIIFLFVSLF